MLTSNYDNVVSQGCLQFIGTAYHDWQKALHNMLETGKTPTSRQALITNASSELAMQSAYKDHSDTGR